MLAAPRRPPQILIKPGAERSERAAAVRDAQALVDTRRDLGQMRDDLIEALDEWAKLASDDPGQLARISEIRKRWRLLDDHGDRE